MAFLKEELKKKDAVIMDEMKKEIDKAEKEEQQEAEVVEPAEAADPFAL